jgi:hypothetical protein
MSLSMIFGETELDISINTSTYETDTGFDISTNTDLIFILKSDPSVGDVSAEYSVTKGADLSFASNTMTAKINDWTSLSIGIIYYIGFGFKLAGDTEYREIPLANGQQTIQFVQNVISG